MLASTQVVQTFPSVRIPGGAGQLPVEVALIAQLGIGAGDQLYAGATARQRSHQHFIDALDEPSTRLGDMDLAHDDPSSLYSFSVGAKGHPFHRHAGHRVFTAVSGSGGAQLRFSTATRAQIDADPHSFLQQLHFVDIPPDSLFTVRFGGETWHQFAPRAADSAHPAFFALSCHTNELGGALSAQQRAQVLAGEASIPALTELLPPAVSALLSSAAHDPDRVPTVALALHAPAASPRGTLCRRLRGLAGRLRGAWQRLRPARGFLSANGSGHAITALKQPQPGSLLCEAFADGFHHQDTFELISRPGELRADSASAWLAALLQGFLDNPPAGVTRLMSLRNTLVRPLGLRRSPLGCPVSSLLSRCSGEWFAQRFPVLRQQVSGDDRRAEVLLGADDKHLRFRSCVGVEIRADGCLRFSLGTRVQCINRFGRFYMASIDRTHRGYVAPAMLSLATAWAIARRRGE
jgi:Protein of unknown function (DUF2867)